MEKQPATKSNIILISIMVPRTHIISTLLEPLNLAEKDLYAPKTVPVLQKHNSPRFLKLYPFLGDPFTAWKMWPGFGGSSILVTLKKLACAWLEGKCSLQHNSWIMCQVDKHMNMSIENDFFCPKASRMLGKQESSIEKTIVLICLDLNWFCFVVELKAEWT